MLNIITKAVRTVADLVASGAETIMSAWGVIRATVGDLWQTADAWWHQVSPHLEKGWCHVHTWASYAEWGVAIFAVLAVIYLVRKHGVSGLKHKFLMWIERIAHLLHAVHVGSPASIVIAIIMIVGAAFGVPHDHGAPPPPSAPDVHWPF